MLRRIWIPCVCIALALSSVQAKDDYQFGPDSMEQPGVPKGKIETFKHKSENFAGTIRDCWIYVPEQYDNEKPTAFMVFQDGGGYQNPKGQYRVPVVFDNLIHKKEIPVMIGIFVNPGVFEDKFTKGKKGEKVNVSNRSFEYDSLSDQYVRFLEQEIIPIVAKKYNLSKNAADHGIGGASSGGICAFTAAWERPDLFSKVLSHIGSFTNIRGGDVYPGRIRKTPNKNIRIFLQDGSNDLNNEHGNWWLANLQMESSLKYKKYDHKVAWGDGGHSGKHGGAILPESLRWLWRQDTGKPDGVSTAALEATLRNWHDTIGSGTNDEKRKVLEAIFPTKEDLETLFPKHAKLLVPFFMKVREASIEKVIASGAKAARAGKVVKVELMDTRENQRFAAIRKILPEGTAIYDYVLRCETGAAGGGSFVAVNGRWIWFEGIDSFPDFLKQISGDK